MDENNQFVSGLTVGPSCYLDDRKHAKRKQRFTLLNAALDMLTTSPNEKTRKNKKSVKDKNGKINDKKNKKGTNAEGWKNFVGSMRPLHMQASSQSSSPSSRHSSFSDSALCSPLSTPSSSTSSKYASPNNLQELASTGTTSPSLSPNNLQELASTGTTSPILSLNNLQEVQGPICHIASSNNLQELSNTSTRSTSVSADNLKENAGTMKHSVSAGNLGKASSRRSNLGNLAKASSRRKHSALSGNLRELGMSSSKSTSNLEDLSSEKMRRYKSALHLHDLDLNEEIDVEEDADDKLLENCAADMMIDVKADQFIKQFHQQMKSQRKRNVRRQRPSHLAS